MDAAYEKQVSKLTTHCLIDEINFCTLNKSGSRFIVHHMRVWTINDFIINKLPSHAQTIFYTNLTKMKRKIVNKTSASYRLLLYHIEHMLFFLYVLCKRRSVNKQKLCYELFIKMFADRSRGLLANAGDSIWLEMHIIH